MPESIEPDVQRGMTALGEKRFELFQALGCLGYAPELAMRMVLNTTDDTIDEALVKAREFGK